MTPRHHLLIVGNISSVTGRQSLVRAIASAIVDTMPLPENGVVVPCLGPDDSKQQVYLIEDPSFVEDLSEQLRILDDLAARDDRTKLLEKMKFEVLKPAPEFSYENYRPQSNEPFYRGLRKYRKKHRQ